MTKRRRRPTHRKGFILAGLAVACLSAFAVFNASQFWARADGSGTNGVTPTTATAGSTGNTHVFTFTAAESMPSGELSLAVPSGWSAPQGTSGTAGYTTATAAAAVIGTVLDNADSTSGWVAGTACLGGLSSDATVKHEGNASVKCVNGAQSSGNVWYKNIAAQSWTGYTKFGFWIYATAAIPNNNLQFSYDNNPNLVSPIENLAFGAALSANTWTYVVVTPTKARASVASFGLRIANNGALDNVTVYVDDFLVGPGVPTFAGQNASVRLLQAASGNTVVVTYGSGGGASGAVAPTVAGPYTFNTTTRTNDSGTLSPIGTSPVITVNPGPVSQFALNAPADVGAGTRAAYTVTRQDAYGNSTTTGAQTVYLYSNSTGTNKAFYNVASGGSPVASVTIGAGNASADFWYYDEKPGSWTVTASDNATAPDGTAGIDDATDALAVTPGSTSQFLLNAPADIAAGTRAAYTVTRQDAFGNAVTAGLNTVYLYGSSTGNKAFYSVASGGSPIASIVISGGSAANFWYYDDKAGNWNVTASDNASSPDGAAGIADAVDSIGVSAGAISQFLLNAPSDIAAGTRAAYTVTRADAYGNAVTSGSNAVYLYSSSTGNKAFYDVASGGSPITSIAISSGSTADFWYYDDKAGSWNVTASDNASSPDGTTGINDAVDALGVTAAATFQFLLNAPANIAAGTRAAYTITRKDAFNNLVTSGGNTVYLYSSSTGSKAFYNVASGGSPITSIVISSGSTADFWYQDDKVGNWDVTASDNASSPDGTTGIDDAMDTIGVTAASTSQFLLNAPANIAAGTRAAYTVTRKDAFGNLVTSGSDTVHLSSSSTGNKAFYSVASGGSPITSISISGGGSTADFWYYDDKAGNWDVAASDNASGPDGTAGIDDAVDTIGVTAGAVSRFLLNDPGNMGAGTRLAYAVSREDAYGNAVTAGSNTVYLYSSSTGNKAFYSVESGGTPVASILIADGNASANVWYYDDKLGSWTVTASDNASEPDGTTGIDDATDGVTVTVGPVAQFTLNAPADIAAGTRAAYTVTRKDQFDNLVTSGTDTVHLSSTSTGNKAFYSAASGGSPITSIDISGGSTADFWYQDDKAGNWDVTASDNAAGPDGAAGIDDAVDALGVSAGSVSQFLLNAPADIGVGARAAYTVTRKDQYGNAVTSGSTTVHLFSSSTGNKAFYDVASGGSPVTSVSISGGSTADFWYYDDKVGTWTVTASDNASGPDGTAGIDDAADDLGVTTGPTAVFLLTAPADISAGARAAYTVTRKDAFGNLVTAGTDTVHLSSTSTGNKAFYNAASGGSPVTSIDISGGNGTVDFWYYDDKAGSWTVTASDNASGPDGAAGIDDATDDIAVLVNAVAKFALNAPADVEVGARAAYAISREDAFGNPVTAGTTPVYLFTSSTGAAGFYLASSGGTAVTSLSIADGQGSANFWYQDTKVGSWTVTASDNVLGPDGTTGTDDAADTLGVTAAPTAQFLISDVGSVAAGQRAAYTVTRADHFGNPVTNGSDTVYLYSSSAGTHAFYDAASGGTPVASVAISDGNSTVNFWYADEKAGNWDVTASDHASSPDGAAGIDDAVDALTVDPGSVAQFSLNDVTDVAAGARAAYVLERKDQFGNAVTAGTSTAYLTSSSTGAHSFYDVSSGGSPITSIQVTSGNSSAAFWYRDLKPGAWTVTASDNASGPDGAAGIADAADDLTVHTGPTSQFLLNAPADIAAGSRAAYTLTRKDQFGNLVTEGTDTAHLTSSSTGTHGFYDAESGGTAVTSVAISGSNSSVNFWYEDTKAGAWTVTASDNASGPDGAAGINDGQDSMGVTAGAAAAFALSDAGNVAVHTRAAYAVSRVDAYGNPASSGASVAHLHTTSTGGTSFFDAPVGGGIITSVIIPDGSTSANFWYEDDKPGTWTISAADTGMVDGTDEIQILAEPIVATRFVIVDPADGVAGGSVTVTVRAEDAAGNVDTTYESDVTLAVDGAATGGGLVDIVRGVGTRGISDLAAETVHLSLSDSQGTALNVSSTQDVAFAAGATARFSLNEPADFAAGTRAAYVVTRKDANGNAVTSGSDTVYFYSTSTGNKAFYNAASGGSVVTFAHFASGSSTADAWYYDDKPGAWTVTASDNASGPDGGAGIADATDAIAVTVGGTARFTLNAPADIVAGTRAAYVVTRKDLFGNPATVGADTVYLRSTSTGNKGFYLEASGGSAVSSVSIPDGGSSLDVWYQDDKAGTWDVTASDNGAAPDGDAGIADAVDAIVVSPASIARFALTDPGNMSIGTRIGYAVTRQDAFGNPVTADVSMIYLFTSSTGHAGFFNADVAGSAITSLAITPGNASAAFWYGDDKEGTWDVTASDNALAPDGAAGIADATDPVTVSSSAIIATRFTIASLADNRVGVPLIVTVQAEDARGNIDTSFQHDVTLIASGAATGDGLVNVVNGIGTKTITDQTAETVRLSLSDSERTGLNADATQDVRFFVAHATLPSPVAGTAPEETGPGAKPAVPAVPGETVVRFSGFAAPGSEVTAIAQAASGDLPVVQQTIPGADGSFTLSFSGAYAGTPSFGLQVTDPEGHVAPMRFFTLASKEHTLTKVDLTAAPTVILGRAIVTQGDTLLVRGFAAPQMPIQLLVDGQAVPSGSAGVDGRFEAGVSTVGLELGTHTIQARNNANGTPGEASLQRSFAVSNLLAPKTDINGDGKVDISDWSIFLSLYGSPSGQTNKLLDMNGDGKVDISDFSMFIRTINP